MVNRLGLLIVWIVLTGASPSMKVEMHSDMLTIHVRDAALSQVLEAIGEGAGLKFIAVGKNNIAEVHVSDDFTDLPLEEGVARLLAGWDYALIRDKETMRPKEIYIVTRTETDQVSIEALRQLNEFQDAQALEVLRQALQSMNTEVRLTALEIMLVQKVRDGAALEEARHLSIADPLPEVREKALEIVRRYGPIRTESRESPDLH
jgi:hypothetical protein